MIAPDFYRRIGCHAQRLLFPALLLAGLGAPGALEADDLPAGVKNSQNPADISLSPQESLKRITVPDGFHVTLFAGEPDLRRPIAFDFDDRGRLWVVENYAHPKWNKDNATDRILVFEDTNHDGEFDQRTVFWDKGRYLTGIVVGHGGVWVANTPELSFIPDRDGNDVPDSEPIVMLDGFQVSSNNVINNFHWGPDGWLYGAIGLNQLSKVGKPGTPEAERTRITRGMWRFHPVDHRFEKLAGGMVNPWGADFNEYGDLITSNTVLAHLWHIVPGMTCERRAAEQENPYVYERIQSITNHLHWGGGAWTNSRNTSDNHSVAGGGHAHCGGMIYLGDNWPTRYRGTFFTNNLHGNRVNNDRLVPRRSSYVGVHGEDFLFGNDPWFRGLSIKYGPDGGVYISDWHDLGECHDSDGSHRSSGRIYKVVYGKPAKRSFNLQQQTAEQLVQLHLHSNEWFVRHARRILQERAVAGVDLTAAKKQLRAIFASDKDELNKLRSLWTLYVLDDLKEQQLVSWLAHDSQHVRRWAVRLLVDRTQPGQQAIVALAELAASEESAKVRLALAVALQKLELDNRWAIAAALVTHDEDAVDPYLPLMIWYGVEPLVQADRARALQLAVTSGLPRVRRFVARRVLDVQQPVVEDVVQAILEVKEPQARLDLLQGMLDVLQQRGEQSQPQSWPALYRLASASSDAATRSVAVRLATIFGDKEAIAQIQKTIMDPETTVQQRRDALAALLKLDNAVSASLLHGLVADKSSLRRDAIQGLVLHNDSKTPQVLLERYPDLSTLERQDAIGVLSTRRNFAADLLGAIEAGDVQRQDVSAFALQQLRTFSDVKLQERVTRIWADDSQQLQKSDQIAHYKRTMTPKYLQQGDASAGRLLFTKTCAKCHSLFGEGGSIGPELTGSGRKKTDYVLSNLFDPSATIDPAYRLTNVLTSDGRLLSGFIVYQDDRFIEVRTQEARIRLSMKDVDELVTSRQSMMPEGMLRQYTDQQVRDLLRYLASPEQVPLPAGSSE